MSIRFAALLSSVLPAFLLTACGTAPKASFYTLNEAVSAPAPDRQSRLVLAIGPIDMPQYLDRPQIVTRAGGNRLSVDEFNRWGGRLDEEASRVLAQRIGHNLGTRKIFSYPSRIAPDTDYRIGLDIRGFDGVLGGHVTLDVAWSLVADRTGKVVATGQTLYRAATGDASYDAYAAALSQTLEQLADELAAVLRGLEPEAKTKSPPVLGGQIQ